MREDQKIGLLVITGVFPPDISGGSLQIKNICRNLPKENVDIYILTSTFKLISKGEVVEDGIQIRRIFLKSKGIISKIYLLLKMTQSFIKIRDSIDIVLFSGFFNRMMPLFFLSKLFKKKIVQRLTLVGEDDPFSILEQKFGFLKFYIYSKADFYVSVSPALTNKTLEHFDSNRVREISVGVDTTVFAPPKDLDEKISIKKELSLALDKKIIIFVGLICERKGVDILIEAWKRIRQTAKSGACVILVGSTDESHYMISENFIRRIKQDISAYQMEKEILFIKENDKINKYLKASDIFAFPSRAEGMPNALLEAMASGLACISTRLPGITDSVITDDKNGLLFEVDNSAGLAEHLDKVLKDDNYALRLGENGRKEIIKNYSIDRKAKEYMELFRNILN